MTFVLRYAARSDRGLIRGNNQDSVYAGPRLLAVADGMGGHVGGEVASKIVISEMAPLDEDTPGEDLIAQLRQAAENANAHLRDVVAEDPALEGMGTTLTAMLFAGNRLGLVHVGDSRAYLLRGGQLTQITHDDTFVQALVDEGRLTEEEASMHPQRSLILRCLNGAEVEPDLSIREARVDDRFLLCSDGLSGVVSTETLYEALSIRDPQKCADRLIELALRGGGPDNVTCIVADVLNVGYGDDAPVVDGAAGDNQGQRRVAPDSAAGRAALADPNRSQELPAESVVSPPRRRHRLRTAVFALVALLLLAGAGYGVWQWTQSQFFVAADGARIAVYRGVNASLGPVHLYRVDHPTDLRVSDLQQIARDQVRSGISAKNEQDAERILANLRDDQMPLCPSDDATSTSPAPSPTRGTPSPSPANPSTSTSPTGAGSPHSSTAAPTGSTDIPVPGRDCRVSD